ncbi:hypothetical protein ACP70R_027763 [Stipagrostis hirtigluma subsp. patula]
MAAAAVDFRASESSTASGGGRATLKAAYGFGHEVLKDTVINEDSETDASLQQIIAEVQRRAGAVPVGARAERQLAEHWSPHLVMLEIQEVLQFAGEIVLTSEIEVDGVGEVAGAGNALDEGGDGHGLDIDHVRHRRHGEEPLRVAAHRRVASPLGVYHRHTLKMQSGDTCLKLLLCYLGIEHIEGLWYLSQRRHGARPGEELVAEPVQMLLDLRRRQWRRLVLLDVHHVLAAHAEPYNHMRPVLLDESARPSPIELHLDQVSNVYY